MSLMDGYNLPMQVVPQGTPTGASGNYTTTGYLMDVNKVCPLEQKVTIVGGQGVDYRALARGAYGNPNTCQSSTYSAFFKNAIPQAYN
ncbi:hypothetical protein Taro_029512 [Colocasia esculenta]|uniref:Uncharacterized protein n=1 Tax=Colocasia esculenta TaxID=4460 RepID=A0A843VJ48_COLES|nr:hypothetical protein [Colocasia esculenta]